MKKNILLLISFFFVSSLCFGQFVDAEAKAILDKTSQNLQKSTGTKAEFSLVIDNAQTGKKKKLEGNILIKGNKFKMSIDNTETYFDGNLQSVYVPASKEVTISVPTKEELQDVNPTAIVSSYKKGYKLKKEEDKTINGKAVSEINIYPEDRKKPFYRIDILVEKQTNNIISISTYGKNGATTIVKIKKYESDLNLSDNSFVFDKKKYPGVEVIDLR
jgi:outer membrane lipoprotein-sorting protein